MRQASRSIPLLLSCFTLASAGACAPKVPCPPDMALIPGSKVCIDRYEAALEGGVAGENDGKGMTAKAVSKAGVLPAVQVSQLQAKAACANAGKRLCSKAEWMLACQGAEKRAFPYGGAKWVPERCADRALTEKLNSTKPQPTGSLSGCRTPEGVFDLSGNVWEWLADTGPDGNPAVLIGGGFGNDSNLSCAPHEPFGQPVTQQGEAMGFRCCR
ncbi:MAG: SUMF1/EgtB/PvdO family nonheme iron enzyme [Deltaproteobacteria bacterium]|nr:SUMF1/EgtB/PvdO family nonheme iron enzyme [Deltaproteobacteria bacterium]